MKRRLTPDEKKLWEQVTRTVTPDTKVLPAAASLSKATEIFRSDFVRKISSTGVKPTETSSQLQSSHAGAILDNVEPRSLRRVQRGKTQIDATLDLHGMTQDIAFSALQLFLERSRVSQYRVVLVVTGKGRNLADGTGGILRKRFVQWMDGPFLHYVSGINAAHQRHGGTGAFYLFLKRRSRAT